MHDLVQGMQVGATAMLQQARMQALEWAARGHTALHSAG